MAGINPRAPTAAYLILIGRLIVSATFILAALPKIQDPAAFATSVEGYRVVTGNLTVWIALALPWLELVAGFGLLTPQIRRGSALVITLLLIAFIVLHVSAWARGLDINCGCFSADNSNKAPDYLWLIFRNIFLLATCTWVMIRDWQHGISREDVSTS
ncbi:MAG: MauE/DoxX family redox-associated membrane protein [Verrucomicrobiota bacterium]|nr:MauE/DoxX family redox-associated membrane protein [Verrucomicrobiota bacterium]MEC8280071.1 MauE/DoxX family redox-associated membrane protein [Verrucomicrobiota bacterium]